MRRKKVAVYGVYLVKILNISPPSSHVRNTYPNEKKEGGDFDTN